MGRPACSVLCVFRATLRLLILFIKLSLKLREKRSAFSGASIRLSVSEVSVKAGQSSNPLWADLKLTFAFKNDLRQGGQRF